MALHPQPDPPMVARHSGDSMSRAHIPWFNPCEMDDETVLMLNTGREALLAQFFRAVRERLAHPGIFNHWLLTGMRGAGKSFFLRLVQVGFKDAVGQQARFVLLPEEHRNIYAPHEFLAEIQRMLNVDQGAIGASPAWRVEDANQAWEAALGGLLKAFTEPLLVIGVENFDKLLEQAFSDETDNSRLRHLMSFEPRIMLCATAVRGDFDENYNQRLFRQFEHHPIPRWDAADHRDYLARRAKRENKEPTLLQLARIDAYTRYTGGNARAAAVLAGAILDDIDPWQAARNLDEAIEKMSDYYRNLIERVPVNTRKLFDALVRGGEPASQTEIAERTGARQNDISRAFMWLVDHGYISETRQLGQKTKQYRVLDRLFVQFYRMRSINPGQRSKLALMAELLADTLAFQDKWRFANRYSGDGKEPEARTFKAYDAARAEYLEAGLPDYASWNLGKRAWCQSTQGNLEQALAEHKQALEESLAQNQISDAAWNLGQMARIVAGQSGAEAAWALLDSEIGKAGGETIHAIQQLGDAVFDKVRQQGEAVAFALGCDLLQGLAERPAFPAEAALRALWIDMIDMGVPHGLLRDLLGEWHGLFGERHDAGMQALNQLLRDWLDDLDTPNEARETRRLMLDPDLATTLTALAEGLSPKARQRLGLTLPDKKSNRGLGRTARTPT